MREILFRGKPVYGGKMVEGYLEYYRQSDNGELVCYIAEWGKKMEQVIPETVGQYTGLKDKNGKRIFDGDIVNTGLYVGLVRFRNGAFEVFRKVSGFAMYDMTGTDIEYEVIGNIHDNPELLEDT